MNKKLIGMINFTLIFMNVIMMPFSTIMASPENQSLVTDGVKSMTSLVIGVDKTKPNAYGRMRDLAAAISS